MDTITLVNPDIESGRVAAKAIESNGELDAVAAFWWYETSAEEFRFVVATPLYKTIGPEKTYLKIHNLLKKAGLLSKIPLSSVWPVDSGHELVMALRTFLAAPRVDEAGFENCYFNGFHIKFLHVYFLKKSKAGTRKKK